MDVRGLLDLRDHHAMEPPLALAEDVDHVPVRPLRADVVDPNGERSGAEVDRRDATTIFCLAPTFSAGAVASSRSKNT